MVGLSYLVASGVNAALVAPEGQYEVLWEWKKSK